ncbi:MAG: glycosyltransferase [Pseudomonadota bacterium]
MKDIALNGELIARAAHLEGKRLALLLPSLLPVGGVETVALSRSRLLRDLGLRVDLLFVNEPNATQDWLPTGARCINFGSGRLRHVVRPLRRYLIEERPDAVVAAMWPLTALAVVAHKLARSRARLVTSDHNVLSVQYRNKSKVSRAMLRASIAATYSLADARIAVSIDVKNDLARLSGLPPQRFDVVHNPLPLVVDDGPASNAAEAAWGVPPGKRILTVGRLKAQKNQKLLIDAFRLLEADAHARLMILGTGELEDELRNDISAHGLAGRVLMPGHVDQPVNYYKSADLFALTSDAEGFGNVLLEALACGLPIVSTDCPGGPREILADGAYGRLVAMNDAAAFSDAIKQGLEQGADPNRQRQRAEQFSLAATTTRYLDVVFPAARH